MQWGRSLLFNVGRNNLGVKTLYSNLGGAFDPSRVPPSSSHIDLVMAAISAARYR